MAAMVAAAWWAQPGPAYAQSECEAGNTCISASMDWEGRSEGMALTVGHPVTITIEATHPPTSRVIFPSPDVQWDDVFEVKSRSPASRVEEDDRIIERQSIEVALFAPGEHETPPLVVAIIDSEGKILDQPVPPITLNVASVLAADDEELKDIRPQADLSVPPIWPVAAGTGAAVLLVGAGLYLLVMLLTGAGLTALWKRGRPAAAVSAYRLALNELDRIEGLELPAAGRFKEHYTLVADALRRYLEGEYGIPAMDRTTSEIKKELIGTRIAKDGAEDTWWLLLDCDIVKFTRMEPDIGEARRLVDNTRDLLHRLHAVEAPHGEESAAELAEAGA